MTQDVYRTSYTSWRNFPGRIAAIARFDDEVEALKKAGVDAAFNVYGEAGAGFAEHISREMDEKYKSIK